MMMRQSNGKTIAAKRRTLFLYSITDKIEFSGVWLDLRNYFLKNEIFELHSLNRPGSIFFTSVKYGLLLSLSQVNVFRRAA
jgi:hypothetical protein